MEQAGTHNVIKDYPFRRPVCRPQ